MVRHLLPHLILSLFTATCLAQDRAPRIEVTVDKQSVYLGESFNMEILVQNVEREVSPSLTSISNCTIKAMGSRFINQSSTRIINGEIVQNVRRGFVMQYEVKPTAVGLLTLAGINAEIKGKDIKGNVAQVNVIGPQNQDFVLIDFYSDKTNITIYEEFTLSLDINIKQLPGSYGSVEPLFPASPPTVQCDIFEPNAATGLATTNTQALLREMLQQRRTPSFYLNDFTLQAGPFSFGGFFGSEQARFKIPHTIITNANGTYYTYSFTRTYAPTKTGIFDFPAATLKGVIPTGVDRNGAIPTNIFASADDIRIRVTAPEGSKKYPSYTGAISTGLTARAELNQQTCNEGDPLNLDLFIKGAVNPEDIRPIKLSTIEDITALFDVYDDNVKTGMNGDEKSFAYTLRPRKAGTIEVPPIDVTFYDMTTKEFKTVTTRAIPIRVNKSHQITSSDILTPTATNTVQTLEQPLGTFTTSSMSMSSAGITTQPLAESWHWQAAAAGPVTFAVIMFIRGLTLFYRNRESQRKNSAALHRAHRLLDEAAALHTRHAAGVDECVLEAMRLIIGQQLRRPPESLTPDDFPETFFHFTDFSKDESERLITLFENCFNAGFANQPASVHLSDIELVIRLMREVKS